MESYLKTAIKTSIEAGKDILKIYDSEFDVDLKEDKSPLTKADRNSHDIISKQLSQTEINNQNIPVLSEEGKSISYEERKNWNYYWIIDPLDGTKEFIKKNGEFTVNIALAKDKYPIMGIIYVPVKDLLYFSIKDKGAFKTEKASEKNLDDVQELISLSHKLPLDTDREKYTVVASKSHFSEETKQFVDDIREKHGEIEFISAGSSLKICLVAEDKADIYPRLAPTMEWDTAAGQVIAEESGCRLIDRESGKRMRYNKKNLKNNHFVVEKKD